METVQYVLLAAVIAGITELIKRLRGKDYWGAVTILTSGIVGGLFGIFSVEGLTFLTGVAAGFGASGTLTAVAKVSSGTTTNPSSATK